MRTTLPEATEAKQNWPEEAMAAARKELMAAGQRTKRQPMSRGFEEASQEQTYLR
jgi:hypothetical protein